MQSEIMDDKRPISAIYFDGCEDNGYTAANGFVIESYGEPGLHCALPWFRVSRDGEVIARVPAGQVAVCYEASS